MLINWFTVGAQVVNFLILVWLMRRYLYRPILAAIDARAKEVASVLTQAESKMADATRQLTAYQEKTRDFDADRGARMAAVEAEISNERDRMMQSAKHDSEAERLAQATELLNHQTAFAEQLSQSIEAEVFAISRRAIGDLANADLEHQIIGAFIRQLSSMETLLSSPLVSALKQASESASVKTSFELSEVDRASLQTAIDNFAGVPVAVSFETTTRNLCGVELSCGGQRAGWSIADYLDRLKANTASMLEQGLPAHAHAEVLAAKPKVMTASIQPATNDSATVTT